MPARPIRIAIQIAQMRAPYQAVRDACVEAEGMGADMVLNLDHFFPYDGDHRGAHFEALTMLASIAEATEQAELGCLVTCIGYRNPNLLADMARTIDHISGGRFVLGLGAGWFELDYEAYGFEFPPLGQRISALEHDIVVIRERLGVLDPPPLRRMPFLIGAEGERRMLPLVAREGDIWHTYATGSTFRAKSAVLDEACRAIGRDPAEVERSVGVPLRFDRELADDLADAGATLFTLEFGGPRFDLGRARDWLRWRDERNRATG
jgi:probable F420-dependent oxidoreductase